MTDREFEQFRDVMITRVGIANLLSRKESTELDIGPALLSELRSRFDSKLVVLKSSSTANVEWQQFLKKMCNAESYFFREQRQLNTIASLVAADKAKAWRLWSLPCSRGEEPYSLAMLLLQKNVCNFHVIGSDIRADLLEVATHSEYSTGFHLNPFREMPAAFWSYFQKNGQSDKCRIVPMVREYVSFTRSNILEPSTLPSGMFDVILCRNLLIYFDDERKRSALRLLWSKLAPGGYLCVGASDSIFAHLDLLEGVDDSIGNAMYKKRGM